VFTRHVDNPTQIYACITRRYFFLITISNMSNSNSYSTYLTPYYLAVSSNIFLYEYILIMIIGFIGNICQIMIFSRKNTGILFLVLSISDSIYVI